MSAPCPPAYHSAATLARWAIWRAAHPAWEAAAVALGCGAAVVGGVRALPAAPAALAAPPSAPVFGEPLLAGPLDTGLLPLGAPLAGVPGWGGATLPAVPMPPLAAAAPFAPPGQPVIVLQPPLIVPLYPAPPVAFAPSIPERPGQPVPEPPAILLFAAAVLILAVARWRR